MARPTVIYSGIGTQVAKLVGTDRSMDAAAETVLAKAKQIARTHRQSGAYMDSFGYAPIKGKKGVIDREVFNEDPAAHIIESGYLRKTATGIQHVAGQFILTRAAKEV